MTETILNKCYFKDIIIRTYEIDIAGHVNNIVYIKWIEDLRIELFESFFSVIEQMKNNFYPVVVSTEITYKKQLIISDKPTGKIYLDSISHGIIILKIEFTCENKIVAHALQKCVIMNLSTGKMDNKIIRSFLKNKV
jgi:acyl-CoA thioester hydrolase